MPTVEFAAAAKPIVAALEEAVKEAVAAAKMAMNLIFMIAYFVLGIRLWGEGRWKLPVA